MPRVLAITPLILAGCQHAPAPAARPAPVPAATTAAVTTIALPGAPPDGVFLDYLAFDPVHHTVWVPAGGTGNVDVIDARSRKLTAISGFVTQEIERRGQKRKMGPSSAAVGAGVVYVGNRGDSSVCAFDGATLAKQGCVTLDSSPDGLQYIAATKELWVTTPRDQSIRTLDVSTPGKPVAKDTIKFDGEPEGFAIDEAHGKFFTNLEDKDKTLVVDVKSHAVVETWNPGCGEDGPKGLIFEPAANQLLVVCPDKVETLDVAKQGAIVGSLTVGDGLDAIDYLAGRHQVIAAAGRAEKLVVARLEPTGTLTAVATIPTAKGARNAVVSDDGTIFVADGPAGAILVVPAVP